MGYDIKTQGLNTKGNFTLCALISLFPCLNKVTGYLVYGTFFCSFVVSGQQCSTYNVCLHLLSFTFSFLWRFDSVKGHGLPLRGFTTTLIGHTTLNTTPLDE